jgi:ribosomal-protein-alanine N-acetyltransferase
MKMINFTYFPTIETKNLLLRRMVQNDVNDLFEMRNDPRMHEYTDTKVEENLDETQAYVDKMDKGLEAKKWIIWAIEHKQSHKVIGSIGIWNINKEEKSAELGYGIIPTYQGQGLMRETLLSVIDYGFDVMKLKVLDAYTEETNSKSIKLLEKCEFIEVDRVDDEGVITSKVYRMVVFRLVN